MSGRDNFPPRGAGGGGKGGGDSGGSRAPVEAPDSLRSIEYARVLDLLCEGEILGLVTGGAESVFLDDTQLGNADGTYNFAGTVVRWVNGTQAQAYLPGFPSVENEVAVGVQVPFATPVVRTITNTNTNRARITLGFPQLTTQDATTGDLTGASVAITIDLQANGAGYARQVNDSVSGKSTTHYQRSYEINLTGTPPWDIKVSRASLDSVSSALQNKSFWDSYTEVIDAKLSYPNSALVGLQLDASQFSAVPRRAYEIYGLKIPVPSNYNPTSRVYTGVWDGTFVTAWTDNPAWCFYDLLTNQRYGLGKFVAVAQVDKWALYSIAQYCDQLVPDGFGGTEPRYRCNLYLQTRAEAFKVIANMASIFRGMTYWGAGAISTVADKPADPIALFTNANVIDGKFSYSGSAKNARHTVALVTWNDPADAYRQKVEYVPDTAGIARYGVLETSVVAFGCTSRGQANRLGKWLLYSERLETETITFRTGLDGVLVYPGAIINTSDAPRAGKRVSGRVAAATTAAVTIDSPVTLASGTSYVLMCIAPDGTVVSGSVSDGAGATGVLHIFPVLSQAPQVNAVWILSASDLVPETWRVLSAVEVDKTQLEIVALKYDPNKFAAVEQNLLFESAPTSTVTERPAGVTNLMASEMLFEVSPEVVGNRLTLSWSGNLGRYRVSYRGALSNWVTLPETPSQTIELDGLAPDTYTFNVVQVNGLGFVSPVNTLMKVVYGKLADPADVTGFAVQSYSGQAKFTWDPAVDLDVKIGGRRFIRWSPLTVGAVWLNGALVNPDGYPGSATIDFGPLMTGTYMAKDRDSSGNYSVNMASFVVTEALLTGLSTLATLTESAGFAGTKTNVAVVGGGLQLDSATLVDAMLTNIDVWPNIDLIGGTAVTGSYRFSAKMDLGSVKTVRLFSTIASTAFDTGDLIDARTSNIDDWDSIDGTVIEDAEVELTVRTTNDDPNAAPTWGPWHALGFVGDYVARGFDFELDYASGNPTHNRNVTTLSVAAKQ